MPSDARALTRAARTRAQAENIPYTTARETELAIRERMDADGETYSAAEAVVTDPANQVLCHTCGWTNAMACPECPGACGCWNGRCSGWRHREFMHEDELRELGQVECRECGADIRYGYDCGCG